MKKMLLGFLSFVCISAQAAVSPVVFNSGCASGIFNLALNTCLVTGGGGGVSSVTATAPLVSSGGANPNLTLAQATSLVPGFLTAADWSTFNSKQAALTFGSVSTATTGVSVTNGANSTVGPNVVVNVQTATTAQPGLLSAADWNTFNGKQSALSFGNLTDAGTDGLTVTGGAGSVIGAGTSLSQHVSDTTHNGYLSSVDWNTFNGKQAALTPGSVSTSTTGVTVGSGANSTVGPNVTVNVQTATGAQPGLLSAADWTTFNAKQAALSFGNLTDAGTDGITVTNGAGSVIGAGTSVAQHVADATHNGYLASADWSTFNGKQPAGNYITALTGDVLASGPGSASAVIASSPHLRYIDFVSGDDATGTGTSLRPWKTLQHAYNSVLDEAANNPYTFVLSGGNNDIDAAPITAKPNIALYAPFQINISQPFTVGPDDVPGVGNDVLSFTNVTFLFSFTFVKNDTSDNTIFAVNTDFNGGSTIKQNGSGWVFFDGFDVTLNNAEFKTGSTGALFFHPYFTGTTTFDDADGSAYYQFMGGYLGGQMSITGAPFVYTSGLMIDTPFGASWTNVHSANGDPTIQFDSAGLPPSVTGAYSSVLTSFSQYVGYTPAVPGNWSPSPANVASALDQLASRAVAPGSITLTQNHLLVGNASNVAADVAMSGDATVVASGAVTLATVNGNVGSFGSSTSIPTFTVNGKGLITAASGNAVIAPAGTLTGTTLNATVVNSSLTSVGTIATGTWNGTTVDVPHGGTGGTSFTASLPLIGNGAGALAQGTVSGNTTEFGTVTGALTTNHCLKADASGNIVDSGAACSAASVTSVALADGSTSPIFTISGSPVTGSGTLTETLSIQNANLVFAGPSSGGAAQPTFRTLAAADLPNWTVVNGGNAAYSILTGDQHVRAGTALTAQRTYTLPVCAANLGERHEVKNPPSQTFNLLVAGNGADTVDGAASYTVNPGDSVQMICAVSGNWDVE